MALRNMTAREMFKQMYQWRSRYRTPVVCEAAQTLLRQMSTYAGVKDHLRTHSTIVRIKQFLDSYKDVSPDGIGEINLQCAYISLTELEDPYDALQLLNEAIARFNGFLHSQAVAYWMKGCILWDIRRPAVDSDPVFCWQTAISLFSRMPGGTVAQAQWYQATCQEMRDALDYAIENDGPVTQSQTPLNTGNVGQQAPAGSQPAAPSPQPPSAPPGAPGGGQASPAGSPVTLAQPVVSSGINSPAAVPAATPPVSAPPAPPPGPAVNPAPAVVIPIPPDPPAVVMPIYQSLVEAMMDSFTVVSCVPAGGFQVAGGRDRFSMYNMQIDQVILQGERYKVYNFRRNGKYINLNKLVKNWDEVYLLQVSGDSMNLLDIVEGDYVLVQQVPDANSGDVVVAEITGIDLAQATLKRYMKNNGERFLTPVSDNPEHAKIPYSFYEADFHIWGVVLAVLKKVDP